MAVTLAVPLQNYVKSNICPFTGSEALWLTSELAKLERSIAAINAALAQLALVA
jgi:hypothetical protein